MNRVSNMIKNPLKILVKRNSLGTFTYADFPEAKKQFITFGTKAQTDKAALEHFNSSNNTNFMTIQLISFEAANEQLELQFKNDRKTTLANIQKLKKMFNKNK